MGQVDIIEVTTPKMMHEFIRFPFKLYKGNPYWAPLPDAEERKTLSEKNPALQFCDLQCILAMRDKEVVGRMALIINHRYNQEKECNIGRFGWVDFIDDYSVSKYMFDYAITWHKQKGMTELHGPLGFTDFDPEGMLTQGFDQRSTMSTIYNYSYYNQHVAQYGFTQKATWSERILSIKPGNSTWITEKFETISRHLCDRFKVRLVYPKSKKELLSYGKDVFELINISYNNLYGFTSLTDEQVKYYLDSYFPLAIPNYIPLIVNQAGKLVGFAISFPSFTSALQKINGKLFPFGFLRLLWALKRHRTADIYLAAIHPDYRNKGLMVIVMKQLAESFDKTGVKEVETNIILDTNFEMSNFYSRESPFFSHKIVKKRSCYALKF